MLGKIVLNQFLNKSLPNVSFDTGVYRLGLGKGLPVGCFVNNRSGFRAVMAWILTLGLISTVASQAFASAGPSGIEISQATSTVFKSASVLPNPEVAPQAPDAESAALAFIDHHSAQWGVSSQTVHRIKTIPGAAGLVTLRFVQTASDMDVLGSLLALTLDKDQHLVSFDVTTLQIAERSALSATLSQDQAEIALQNEIAATHGALSTQVAVTKVHQVLADSSLVPGIPNGLHVAWMSWTALTGRPDSTAVSVLDDATSKLLYSAQIAQHVTYTPNVCDLQSAVPSDYSSQNTALGSTNLVRSYRGYMYINSVGDLYPLCGTNYAGRNTASSGIALSDIDTTWNFYKDVLNVDINDEEWLGNISNSINGDRNPRISAFTNVCMYDSKSECPSYGNAFWVAWSAPTSVCRTGACSGIFMGAGFDQALDVIAHELTHGMTYSIAFQDGFSETSDAAAMSEGLSDVFGEAAERLSPDSAADPTWKVGENVSGADPGPYRVMKSGTSLSPQATKPAITKDWKKADGHVNSGPLNRFAWLIANGATVGSTTVAPLGTVPSDGICHLPSQCTGISRMSVLMYQALPALTSASTYFDFGQAVMNACQTLVSTSVSGFNADACTNVGRALRLTGISNLTITNLTSRSSIKKYTTMTIVASAESYAGARVSKQPLQLEQFVKGKWTVLRQPDTLCKRYCTNAQGRVTYSVKWSKSARYRVRANCNFGAMVAQTRAYFIRVY